MKVKNLLKKIKRYERMESNLAYVIAWIRQEGDEPDECLLRQQDILIREIERLANE